MSDILNYRFYLNFKNEGSFGRIEITESFGVDGLSFVVEQDDKRYGRDVYKINEEVSLRFLKGNYDKSTTQQLPNGTVIYYLTMGFDWLLETFKRFKFESDVDFEMTLNDLDFIVSNLDFQTSQNDGYSYFECKALQEQGKQIIKRRADIVTDIFSTEDLDGNEVTPAQTENILIKAKPLSQSSTWVSSDVASAVSRTSISNPSFGIPSIIQLTTGCNPANQTVDYEIEDSLSYISLETALNPLGNPNLENFTYLQAKATLTGVNINLTNIEGVVRQNINNFFTDEVLTGSGYVRLVVKVGLNVDNISETYNLWQQDFNYVDGDSTNTPDIDVPESFSILLDTIGIGQKLYIYFETYSEATFTPAPYVSGTLVSYSVVAVISNMDVSIDVISTSIDTVVKGVRYIDVFKENLKRINDFTIDAARYDENGEYYEQFVFTGNLIKQRNDLAFPVKFKDITSDLIELNSDYQIIDGKVYIGQYQDFYTNKEIGAFLSAPDSNFKNSSNERYSINEFSYSYEDFEQDRDEEGTTDSINTKSQWLTSNKKVENTKRNRNKTYS